jgi:hypothetical protein
LAGEYRVCSELNKRGVFATITYGNRKGVDVYAISDQKERALKIEVKTSQGKKFVTSLFKKGLDNSLNPPDFWVLFQILSANNGSFVERFFILSHDEIHEAQEARRKLYCDKYFLTHGRHFDVSTGVDCVRIPDVEAYEDKWSKIIKSF